MDVVIFLLVVRADISIQTCIQTWNFYNVLFKGMPAPTSL